MSRVKRDASLIQKIREENKDIFYPDDGVTYNFKFKMMREFIVWYAAKHGLTVDQFLNNRTKGSLALIRMNAVRILYAGFPKASTPKIGMIMRRDHTTILYALDTIERRKAKSKRSINAQRKQRLRRQLAKERKLNVTNENSAFKRTSDGNSNSGNG